MGRNKKKAHKNKVRGPHLPPALPKVSRIASDELRIHAFVDHYRKSFNASDAAMAAGYAASNSRKAGSNLLDDGRVQELLAKHALDAMAETNIRVADIVRAANEIAQFDPIGCWEQLVNARNGVVTLRIKDITEMPPDVRRCIASFKIVKKNLIAGDAFIDTILEVKFWNKLEALKLLAMYKNILNQKADDALLTAKQIEKMSDEELAASVREASARWDRHVAARNKARLALVPKLA